MEQSFAVTLEDRLKNIKRVLGSKAAEYAKDDNRLHNFDTAARVLGTTPEKALDGMMVKHEVSVRDMINSPESVTKELVDEKIGDFINYLVLLEHMLLRRVKG